MLLAGQSARVVGRSADAQWWVIDFPATPEGQGWVPDSTVLTDNVTDVPIVPPPLVPTATPAPPVVITDWLGEYFTNTYVLDGASIAITAPAATSLACGEPGGIMEQESAYLSLLPLARQAQVVDGNLLLLDGNGQELLQYASP